MSNIVAIQMPKWGMEMSEGVINDWYFAVGDSINAGDDVVDVETSKIVNTVTATHSGVLRAIIANNGETHPVGGVLGVLADADTSDADIQAFIASKAGSPAPTEATPSDVAPVAAPTQEEPAAATAKSAEVVSITNNNLASTNLSALAQGEDDSLVAASPVARRLAQQYGVNLHNVGATGHHGRISKADVEAAVSSAGGKLHSAKPSQGDGKSRTNIDDSLIKATPVARRLATELGISLVDCRSSGDRQRVCKADVEAAAALQRKLETFPELPANEPAPFNATTMSGMRKTIAGRLQQSKQTAPHFRVHVDCEIDNLLATRKQINSASNAKVSVNDFVIKAVACALMQVPAVNVQLEGDTIKQFTDADISVAVAIDEGLITPIVKQANRKGLVDISNATRDLATRAKLNRLQPDEFQGGSFCISNLGMFGVKQFDAIINPPQAAILAVGSGEQRPVVKNGELSVATVMSLTLSSDHRVIDGAVAAQFLACLKAFIEQPATMLG